MTETRDISADDVLAAVEYADRIALRDGYHGTREERVRDVQTQYLRAIAVGLGAVANALNAQTRATYTVGGP